MWCYFYSAHCPRGVIFFVDAAAYSVRLRRGGDGSSSSAGRRRRLRRLLACVDMCGQEPPLPLKHTDWRTAERASATRPCWIRVWSVTASTGASALLLRAVGAPRPHPDWARAAPPAWISLGALTQALLRKYDKIHALACLCNPLLAVARNRP